MTKISRLNELFVNSEHCDENAEIRKILENLNSIDISLRLLDVDCKDLIKEIKKQINKRED